MNFHDILMLRGFVGGGGGSGGGAKTWDDLGYSPTGGDTLEWDGNTEGKTAVMGGLYHVSDAIPTIEDFANGCFIKMSFDDDYHEVSAVEVVDQGVLISVLDFYCWVIPNDSVGLDLGDGTVIDKPGTYFMSADGVHTTSLTIPGYTGFPSVNKVPEKYLPEDYIKGLITEELGVIENGTY